jgi:signal transduction histidine kinase
VTSTLRTRAVFAAFGGAVAAASLVFADVADLPLYVTAFVLLLTSYFFSVDVPPPAAIVLPYLSTVTALVYVGGPPIIAIDYLAKLASPPLKAFLWRHRLYEPPLAMRPLVEALGTGRRAPRGAWIDLWANDATGGTGLAVRWLAFALLTTTIPGLRPIVALAAAELAGQTYWIALHYLVPVPTARWFAKSRRPWSNFGLDEHTDVAFAMYLFFPACMLLVYYAHVAYGLAGLSAAAAATLAPHYVLKLLNDRRETSERLRQANLALERKAHALEEKQEELKSFIYTVTHDLKNPLSAIHITADLVRDSTALRADPEACEHVERIVRIAGATEDMIRDLLDLFRVTSAAEPWGWVDLEGVVRRTIETLGPQIAAKGTRVTVSPLPRIWAQETKIGRVVTNLVSNAVKYVPANRGAVYVEGEAREDHVRFSVRDNGIGISEAYHRGIFELFGRVPGKEQAVDGNVVAGTGVGLAIVKRIVEAHAGTVWVESAPGAGSSFVVELPAAPR